MKACEVMSLLHITRPTLCKYLKVGYIKATKTTAGQYIYDDDSVYAFIGQKKHKENKIIVSYARVSTQNQKDQLISQNQRIYESCISRGLNLDMQLSDIKSGLSENREGLQKLIRLVIENKVKLVVIENKDRLVRFGYEILESVFRYFGTSILVLNDSVQNKSYEQELTDDLISIIHYFSMKSYSHRRKLNKIRRELEEKEED